MYAPAQLDPVERQTVLILKQERERQGISATALATEVGINHSTLTHLERDIARPILWVLLESAGGLRLDLADVLTKASD